MLFCFFKPKLTLLQHYSSSIPCQVSGKIWKKIKNWFKWQYSTLFSFFLPRVAQMLKLLYFKRQSFYILSKKSDIFFFMWAKVVNIFLTGKKKSCNQSITQRHEKSKRRPLKENFYKLLCTLRQDSRNLKKVVDSSHDKIMFCAVSKNHRLLFLFIQLYNAMSLWTIFFSFSIALDETVHIRTVRAVVFFLSLYIFFLLWAAEPEIQTIRLNHCKKRCIPFPSHCSHVYLAFQSLPLRRWGNIF